MFPPSPHDPLFDLDWRWRRAQHLAARPHPSYHPADDAWVRRAEALARALLTCRDDAGRHALAEADPPLWQAHRLATATSPLLRWALEARILAREPHGDAARKCGLLAEAVEAFERVFFNVADGLDATT